MKKYIERIKDYFKSKQELINKKNALYTNNERLKQEIKLHKKVCQELNRDYLKYKAKFMIIQQDIRELQQKQSN